MSNKTLAELLVGKKVRATEDCSDAEAGRVYKIVVNGVGELYLEGTNCFCLEAWIPVDFEIKPKPHKHNFKCADCGVKK